MEERISEYFANSEFGLAYLKILMPLTAEHMKIFMETSKKGLDIDYNEIGTAQEKQVKEMFRLYGLLQTVFNDIETVLIFLRIENKEKITEIYTNLENQEAYFAYHFENYIIRISSVTDIVGKMGNLLYNTGIEDKKCNGYKFREALLPINPDKAGIITELLVKTEEVKNLRHKKVHTGESDIPYLEGVLFYTDLMNVIRQDADPLFEDFVNKDLIAAVERIEQETRELIDIIHQFLNNSVEQLLEIAKPEMQTKK